MGYLIYNEQYSIEVSEPSNLELLRKVGLDVVYSTSRNDIIDKERNEGLIVELINKMEDIENFKKLWYEVQRIYLEDDIKGLYLYYKKEEKQILWERSQILDKTAIKEFILSRINAELLDIFDKSQYQDCHQMYDEITKYILRHTNSLYPEIFMH